MTSSPIGLHHGLPFAVVIAPALAVVSLVPSLAAGIGAFGFIGAFLIAPFAAFLRARARGMTIVIAAIVMATVYAASMQDFN